MYPLIIEIMNVKKNFVLTRMTKIFLDVRNEKNISIRVKIDSSNFSTVSFLDKTFAQVSVFPSVKCNA